MKVFAATACHTFDDRQKSKDAGIDLHLGKPRLLVLTAGEEKAQDAPRDVLG